jgi:hypothetical protein
LPFTQALAPCLRLVLARGVLGRLAVLGAQVALRHVRARQVFDELADAAPADDPVQAFVDRIVVW